MVSGISGYGYLILILFDWVAKKTLCSENFHKIFLKGMADFNHRSGLVVKDGRTTKTRVIMRNI